MDKKKIIRKDKNTKVEQFKYEGDSMWQDKDGNVYPR